MVTLDQLRPGQSGEIVRVEGCDGIACRLREMGFVPGERVRFLNPAPLGDPVSCVIQGSRVALRGREARRISVVSEATVAWKRAQDSDSLESRPVAPSVETASPIAV